VVQPLNDIIWWKGRKGVETEREGGREREKERDQTFESVL
jgi:hypothetical protein